MPKKLDKKQYNLISKIVKNRVKKSKKKLWKLISVIDNYRLPEFPYVCVANVYIRD